MEKEKQIQEDLKEIGIPRAKTHEEIQLEMVKHIWHMVQYWDGLAEDKIIVGTGETTTQARLSGLAFSILGMLDGSSYNLPGFQIIPNPHPDDQKEQTTQGEDYYPYSEPHPNDIGGYLHEIFSQVKSPFIENE